MSSKPEAIDLTKDQKAVILPLMRELQEQMKGYEIMGRITARKENETWAAVRAALPEYNGRELSYNFDTEVLVVLPQKMEPPKECPS
jgi:hypothetical protein